MGIKIIFLSITLVFFFSSLSHSAPSVTSIGGTVLSGSSITISGLNFGAKTTATPLIWEQFNSYTTGQWLKDANPAWTLAADNGMLVTETNCYTGKCINNHISNPLGINKWATNARSITPSDSVYFSYRIRTNVTGTNPYGIGKFGRITTDVPGGSYSSSGSFGMSSWAIRYNTGIGWLYIPNITEIFTYLSTQDWMNNATWERHEIYQKKSTAGVADGGLYFRKGTWEYKNDAIMTRDTGVNYDMKTVYLGGVAANFETGTDDSTTDFTLDDVYVDNTLSRVEICSGSTWVSRGTCEIQIPSAWSDSSITATVNQGTFSNSTTAYLYVVDSAGVASSAHELVFSGNAIVSFFGSGSLGGLGSFTSTALAPPGGFKSVNILLY